jgi:arginine deiminase
VGYLRARLSNLAAQGDFDALSQDLIEGIESGVSGAASGEGPQPSGDAEALRLFIEGQLFYLTPVPNLMYTRDIATVIGDRLLLSRMAAPGRAREPLLLDFVQRFHPRFEGTARWAWAGDEIGAAWPAASPASLYLEGGNVQQLSEGLIVLGVNQRTSLEAVQRLTDAWRQVAIAAGKPIVLYVLRMPAGFNHLDSVFDIIAGNECVAYPPVFEPYGPASVDVVRVELGENPVRPTRSPDFFASLRRDGLDLNVIPVGGDDPVDQQREQWFGGASLLAVAPGKVLIYRSPDRTIAELAARGYRIVDMNDLLSGTATLSLDDPGKWVLKIKGSELSRGHGGMHSMALPLVRD